MSVQQWMIAYHPQDYGDTIVDERGVIIAQAHYGGDYSPLTLEDAQANAAYIVRACNSFDDLVAALTRFLDRDADCDYGQGRPDVCPGIEQDGEWCHWCEARAALRAARGEAAGS